MVDEGQKIRRVEGILVEKTAFLDEDERGACLKLWRAVAGKRRIRGRPESWAAAVYYTYCRMVLREGASRKSVEELFNVSQGTFTRRCTEIRKLLSLVIYDKRFMPPRIYGESPFAELEEALRLLDEREAVSGYFEVKEKRRDLVLLVDLEDGVEYLARGGTALGKLKAGQMVHAALHPGVDAYVFSGAVEVFDPEDAEHGSFMESVKGHYSGSHIERALEIQRDMCKACVEYFGLADPVFESAREAEEALNAFHGVVQPGKEDPWEGEDPGSGLP